MLAVCVLALSSCTNDAAKPKPLASSSESASSSSASASPSAPSLPPEAKGTDEASAEAFVRHWVDVLDYSGPAGDGKSLRRLADRKCVDCDAIADFIDSVDSAGGRIRGKGWTFLNADQVQQTASGEMRVKARVLVNPQVVVARAGARTQRFKGGKRLKTFTLTSSEDTWRVAKLDQGIS